MNDALRKIRERVLAFSPDESGSPFPFSERLAPENRWNPAFARRVIEEYEKFAFLAVAAGHPVVPSDAVDQAWHLHLTCTRSYWEDFCPKVLGRPLHHHPARGGAVERAKFDGGVPQDRGQLPAAVRGGAAGRYLAGAGDAFPVGYPLRAGGCPAALASAETGRREGD